MRNLRKKTHYEILGVKRTASQKEIKQAFRDRAMRHHPDRNPNDRKAHAKFNRIKEAYEELSDPGRRRAYDRSLAGSGAARPRRTETRSYAPPPDRRRPRASSRGSAGSAIERYDEGRARPPAPPQPTPPNRPTVEPYGKMRQREEALTARQARLAEQERLERLAEQERQARLAEQAARQRMQENIRSQPEPEQEKSEDYGAACGCILVVAILIAVIGAISQCG